MATPPQIQRIEDLLDETGLTQDDLVAEFGREADDLTTLSGWTASDVIDWLRARVNGRDA